jgi:hypothetical protein
MKKKKPQTESTSSKANQHAKGVAIPAPAYNLSKTEHQPVQTKKKEEEPNKKKNIQRKLKIGEANDPFEREADAAADKVVKGDTNAYPLADQITPLQTSPVADSTNYLPNDLEQQLNTQKGQGQPLPKSTRQQMETAFGTDFSGVRVHTDQKAVQLSEAIGARAFTPGQ